jgi:hypothetical protein
MTLSAIIFVTIVALGLVLRAYPLRRPDAVVAPQRVDARHEGRA